MTGGLEIRPLDPERDAASLLATWAAVFGREPSRAVWEQRFLRSPVGLRAFVAVHEGRVVAQYAGLPQRVTADGRECVFTQSVDSLVHPDFRRGLKRPGLFVAVARAYFDAWGVHGPDAVHYGWPLPEAWRIGRRMLGYECVREEIVVARELGPADTEAPDVPRISATRDDPRALWERCAAGWGAGAVRDAAFWRWRFEDALHAHYETLGVRGTDGALRGLAVLRCGDWIEPGSRALCDWLVPDEDDAAADRLEAAARGAAARDGGSRLVALLPEWSRAFRRFQDLGWRVRPAPYRLAARCFDGGFDVWGLREGWWLTLADSDLA